MAHDLEDARIAAHGVDLAMRLRSLGVRDVDDGRELPAHHRPRYACLRGCSHFGSSVYGSILNSRSYFTSALSRCFCISPLRQASNTSVAPPMCRSEERRVGKECPSRR